MEAGELLATLSVTETTIESKYTNDKEATKKAAAAAEPAPEDPLPNVDEFSSEGELGDYSESDLDSSSDSVPPVDAS